MLATAAAEGRTLLTETEAKAVLKAAGIPVVETVLAASEQEAVAHAQRIGFPVVLKLHSSTITHKTDVGGVKLNLTSADAVRGAWREISAAVDAALLKAKRSSSSGGRGAGATAPILAARLRAPRASVSSPPAATCRRPARRASISAAVSMRGGRVVGARKT